MFRTVLRIWLSLRSVHISTFSLTLSQTKKFRPLQFAYDNSILNDNGRKFSCSKQVENIVGKGKIARYEQFLLFPQCFQKICTADTSQPGLVRERVKSFYLGVQCTYPYCPRVSITNTPRLILPKPIVIFT